MTLTALGFDADDTLWHNERFFQMSQARLRDLLADHAPPGEIDARLIAAERRNLGQYGFGVKGFTLSMIETAIEVSAGAVPAAVIAEILAAGREMLAHPIELLPHAHAAVAALSGRYRLILITKGDLLDQERKLAQSGLGDLFDAVEIVSDKRAETYERVFSRHGTGAADAAMIGNSMRSDILPMLAAGGWGIHVPHELTWAYEMDAPPTNHPRFAELADLGALPALMAEIG